MMKSGMEYGQGRIQITNQLANIARLLKMASRKDHSATCDGKSMTRGSVFRLLSKSEPEQADNIHTHAYALDFRLRG